MLLLRPLIRPHDSDLAIRRMPMLLERTGTGMRRGGLDEAI